MTVLASPDAAAAQTAGGTNPSVTRSLECQLIDQIAKSKTEHSVGPCPEIEKTSLCPTGYGIDTVSESSSGF